jgi:hypothetical protein
MPRQPLSDNAELSRAARHLIQSHGSRAVAIAIKRAAYLHQCGEDNGAQTWRKIGDYVRAIEAAGDPAPGKTVSEQTAVAAVNVSAPSDIVAASPSAEPLAML